VGVDCLAGAPASESLFRDIDVEGGAAVRAAMVPDFDMAAIDRRIDVRNMDRSSLFAVAATRLALSQALGAERPGGRRDMGLFLHLSAGPSWAESEHISSLLRGNFRINQVAAFPYVVPNSVAGNVCKALRLTGHNTTLSLGPGAGLLGLGFAAFAVKNGHASAIVSLSVDELSKRILSDTHAAGAVPPGGVPYGEGACAVMLETESSAAGRGAAVLGTVCSVAYSTETSDCMNADKGADMLAETIRTALNDARITAADIWPVVCCSAGSTREAEAVRAVMGEREAAMFDPSPRLGYAEATLPLFILSAALADSSLETGRGKKYILVVFGSPHGVNCATVIRKGKVKE
jgi:3-oxoacyl-[acyl-carrier-protein] synthase II